MQRIVIDTNVIVSAALANSYPAIIIEEIFLDKNKEWCVSEEVMLEYQEVLTRAKFFKYPGFVIKSENLLASIDTYAKMFSPKVRLNVIRDPDDNKFLELAVTCNAHFLITGNTNDFTMSKYSNTEIVTPRQYWEKYR